MKLNIIKRGHIEHHGSDREFTNDMKTITEKDEAIMIVPNNWEIHVNRQAIGNSKEPHVEKLEVVDSVTCDDCGNSHFSVPIYNDGETEICCIGCGEPLDRDMMVEKLQVRS